MQGKQRFDDPVYLALRQVDKHDPRLTHLLVMLRRIRISEIRVITALLGKEVDRPEVL